jgi:aryl-alcohol dehydrogenase-like predicted oxidoreductase
MKQREIGNTGIKVSEISLGCWTLGGLNWVNGVPNGWANVDEKEVAAAVELGLEKGVNHFDNADVYGNGKAEQMLARVLGKKIKDLVVATKVGWFPGTAEHAYEPAHIRHQAEQSLINLKRDVIDIYYLHHGDFGEGDRYLEGAARVMQDLKKEGKIKAIGQSAYSHEDFVKAEPVVQPDVLQSWPHAMDTQFIEPGTPTRRLMDERGMSFVCFSPLNQGILLDKFSAKAPPKFEEGDHRKSRDNFESAQLEKTNAQMAKIKERFGGDSAELSRVALQYLLSYECVACAIPGFRNAAQVEGNLAGADRPLSAEDVAFVKGVFQA